MLQSPEFYFDPTDAPLTLRALLARDDVFQLMLAQREALFAISWDREHPATYYAWFEMLGWMARALLAAREASSVPWDDRNHNFNPTRVSEPPSPWPLDDRDYPALRAFKWEVSFPPNGKAWLFVWRGIVAGRDYAELAAVRRQARLAGAPVPDRLPDQLPQRRRGRRRKGEGHGER